MPYLFWYDVNMEKEFMNDIEKHFNGITEEDLADYRQQQMEEEQQQEGVCICGVKDCKDEYAHYTSGY